MLQNDTFWAFQNKCQLFDVIDRSCKNLHQPPKFFGIFLKSTRYVVESEVTFKPNELEDSTACKKPLSHCTNFFG